MPSELIRRFASRISGAQSDPHVAITVLLAGLRKTAGRRARAPQLDRLLKARRILEIEFERNVRYDGCIHPIGSSFDNGFRLTLKSGTSSARIRFTMAHELCHTFFYEYVPELKFRPHEADPVEEHLCNFGAAELLMPSGSVNKHARNLEVSLASLEWLASLFGVSSEAMVVRLRSLELWKCELFIWHRTVDDHFSLDRLIGGRLLEWRWFDPAIPSRAWETGKRIVGRTYVQYELSRGSICVRPVSYEIQRKGNSLIALCGPPSLNVGINKSRPAQLALPSFRNLSVARDQRTVCSGNQQECSESHVAIKIGAPD